MLNKPKISIALCTFNSEKFIQEQMDSLLNQTMLPDEIIVSDDGSTDLTLKLIADYQINSKVDIKVIDHPGHLGVFKNFPYAISNCTGDIIFPCDHDDVWKNDKIEKHIKQHLSHPDHDLIYSNADVVLNTIDHILYPLWEPKTISNEKNGQASLSSLLYKGRSIAGCCMSFRKRHYEEILPFPDKIYHDDYLATTAVIKNGIVGIPEALIYYRQHGSNTVGIIRGRKLSYYKSLFTNVKFYYESDRYIFKRHQLMFDALKKHPSLRLNIDTKKLNEIEDLYQTRSTYHMNSVLTNYLKLLKHFFNHDYQLFNGVFTLMKDFYYVLIVKLYRL